MPARLVYSPKVYCYTQQQSGAILNLTEYVVSGEVQRKLNQVSSATVTLRNPYRQFTRPSQGVAFHPMDPITIYLERIQGYPVRVFTGYLDSTPYYQLYPKTVTLQASCTLKRLLYTWFDPSLPYVYAFFNKYGWINAGDGTIRNFHGVGNMVGHNANTLDDSSISKLLWATLFDIGQWQDSNIFIEKLPNGLVSRVAQLTSNIQDAEKTAVKDFEAFLQNVIGGGSQGSGGGNTGGTGTASGSVQGGKAIVQTVTPIANQYNIPVEMVLAVMYIETGLTGKDSSGNPHYGWFQVQTAAPPYAYGTWSHSPPTIAQAHDLGLSCTAFCSAAAGWVANNPSLRNDIHTWAERIQGVTEQNNPYYATGWPTAIATANSLISQYGSTAGNAITNAGNAVGQALGATTQQGTTAPAKSGGGSAFSGYVNPFSKATLTGSRIDMGVDFSGSGPILAIGDATVYFAQSSGTGWPRYSGSDGAGGFVGYTLSSGPYSGKSIYIAENINPAPGLSNGSKVKAGDLVATLQSGGVGMETGWGSGSGAGTLASQLHQDGISTGQTPNDPGGVQSAAGSDFNNLLKTLGATTGSGGGPQSTGPGMPSNWPQPNGITPGAGTGGGTGALSQSSTATANAFVAELNVPSLEDMVTAVALGSAHMGLMHDQSLMPFVQQMCQASMRNFTSLPNGDFFAFYPDYFGELGHRDPYWLIDDIEILDGEIGLSDDALATHVFAVGDTTWPANNEFLNMLQAGTINIQNAFAKTGILDRSSSKGQGSQPIMNDGEAVAFIQRYGARPLVQQYPMVRSSIFEMFLAYQQFMLAWANQFTTPFTFTFMPELFPGGKVGFPNHGLKMYINSVTHSWNYAEGGFTTTAELSAPSLFGPSNPDLPPNMVEALIEPVRNAKLTPGDKHALQVSASQIDTGVQQILQDTLGILGIQQAPPSAPHGGTF